MKAASVRAEELVGLAESYSPDVLILLEQSKEELDETIQKEIDLWQAEGGLLITFSGNETFAESQRSAFKEAPVDFLKNILYLNHDFFRVTVFRFHVKVNFCSPIVIFWVR